MQLPITVPANRRLHCRSSEKVRLANANINDRQIDLAKQPPNSTPAKYKYWVTRAFWFLNVYSYILAS